MVKRMGEPLCKEFGGFLELKKRECAENGEEFSGKIQPWDIYHFMQVATKASSIELKCTNSALYLTISILRNI